MARSDVGNADCERGAVAERELGKSLGRDRAGPTWGNKVALEDAVANAAHRIERMFTPMSVLLAFLASLGLALALIETLLIRRANRLRVAVLRSQCAFARSTL